LTPLKEKSGRLSCKKLIKKIFTTQYSKPPFFVGVNKNTWENRFYTRFLLRAAHAVFQLIFGFF
jgi:hypothetical protein